MTATTAARAVERRAAFGTSQERFETVLAWLQGEQAPGLSHAALEERLQVEARELFHQLLQDHLDLRACRDPPR